MKLMAEAHRKVKEDASRAEGDRLAAKLRAMTPEERAAHDAEVAAEARRENRKNRMLHTQLGAFGAASKLKPGAGHRRGGGGGAAAAK